MPRYRLTEELWSKLREISLQFSLYNKAGLRKTVEGILFRMRAGAAGGCYSQIIRDKGEALGMSVIIPRRKNSIKGNKGLDWHLYKLRHLVENAFARLKHYRAVATRYDKLARNYASIVSLACAFLWLPM